MMQTGKGNEQFLKEWFGLDGKTAVVVGASQGLGKEIALALAKAGADVVCVARNAEKLDATAAEIRKIGRSARVVAADVSREKDVTAMVQEALNLSGAIDILVYSAGILEVGQVLETELETWRRAMDVNLTGAFLVSREAGKAMHNQGGGRIVLIGSTFGDRVLPFVTPYAVSKGGIASTGAQPGP